MTALLWMLTVAWAGPLLSVRPPGPGEVGVDAGEVWIPRNHGAATQGRLSPRDRAGDDLGCGRVVSHQARAPAPLWPRSLSASRRSPQARRARRGRLCGACGRAAYPALRPIHASALRSTPWGRVALPFARELDADAQAKEWSSESLRSDDQRSRATIAEGPRRRRARVHPLLGHRCAPLRSMGNACLATGASLTAERLVDPLCGDPSAQIPYACRAAAPSNSAIWAGTAMRASGSAGSQDTLRRKLRGHSSLSRRRIPV